MKQAEQDNAYYTYEGTVPTKGPERRFSAPDTKSSEKVSFQSVLY